MQKTRTAALILVATVIAAASSNKAIFALSEKQKYQISERCDTIRETLKSLQHSDSYSRVYLESEYSEIFNNYMVPLNTRLQNNGVLHKELTENQEDFVEMRAKFKTDFITYSKQLENLVNIDCKNKPDDFYDQLEYVRISRDETNNDVMNMSGIISKHQEIVKNIRESYEK